MQTYYVYYLNLYCELRGIFTVRFKKLSGILRKERNFLNVNLKNRVFYYRNFFF